MVGRRLKRGTGTFAFGRCDTFGQSGPAVSARPWRSGPSGRDRAYLVSQPPRQVTGHPVRGKRTVLVMGEATDKPTHGGMETPARVAKAGEGLDAGSSSADRTLPEDPHAVRLGAGVGPSVSAVLLLGLAVLMTAGAAWLAWHAHRRGAIREKIRQCTALCRGLCMVLERRGGADIANLDSLWRALQPPDNAAFLCVIGRGGRLRFHSRRPDRLGTRVSSVRVGDDDGAQRTVGDLLAAEASWSGVNVNFSGQRQIACYSYCRPIESLIVVHLPMSAVDSEVWEFARPWMVMLGVVGAGLLPLVTLLVMGWRHREWRSVQTLVRQLRHHGEVVHDRVTELETLYRAAPVGLCRLSPDLRIERVNDHLCALAGLDEGVVGQFLATVAPRLHALLAETCLYVMRTGQAVTDDLRQWRVNGEQRTVLISCVPLRLRRGSPTAADGDRVSPPLAGVNCVVHDVTELKKVERKLREQIEINELMLNTTLDGYILADDRGQLVEVNPAYCRMVGYGRDELLRMNITELEAALTPEQVAEKIQRMLAAGAARFETAHLHKDGHSVWLDVSISILRLSGRPPLVAAFVRDVTNEKRVTAELRQSEARFRSICDVSPTGVVLFDEAGRVVYRNDRAVDFWPNLVGDSSERFDWTSNLPEGERGEARIAWDAAVRNGKPYRRHGVTRRPHEEPVWWTFTAAPILIDGKHAGHVGAIADVSDRVRREKELQRLNVILERRIEERTRELAERHADLEALVHSMSHDLRAPLRGMYGFAKALLDDCGSRLDDRGREYARYIVWAAEHLDQLIQDLVRYNRIVRKELLVEDVDLDQAVRDALQRLQDEIRASGAEIHVRQPLGVVRGHRSTLEQILSNLISNAVKFVNKGTRPNVEIRSEKRDNDFLRVIVADNGIGIAPEHHQRIFHVLERLHGVESYPGTGVGLAIVQRAVERLGGRVGVESALGQGSRFWFELPIGGTHDERTESAGDVG
ncbi:MAG: PAS domain S-box protein [Planctomycetota bacterium]|nr:MAG: PAS domain S-box protein [Planctomycetota bacterium]